jgi:peptidyl-prolyl cis-trans isomerase SurA
MKKAIFILIFLLSANLGYGKIVDGIAAIVNDHIIYISELNYALIPYIKKMDAAKLSTTEKMKALKNIREKVLDNLINNKLIELKGEELGYKVSDKEVEQVIQNILNEQHITINDLKEALAEENVPFKAYFEKLRKEILRARVVNYFVRNKIIISKEEIEDYIKKHPVKSDDIKFHIAQIFLKNDDQTKIDTILEALQNKPFEEVAKEYSEGPFKDKGGDLGIFKKGEMMPEIEKNLLTMKEGEVKVVKTPSGVHIIKLIKIIKPKIDKKLLYKQAENILKSKKMEKELNKWLKELRAKAVIVKKF